MARIDERLHRDDGGTDISPSFNLKIFGNEESTIYTARFSDAIFVSSQKVSNIESLIRASPDDEPFTPPNRFSRESIFDLLRCLTTAVFHVCDFT